MISAQTAITRLRRDLTLGSLVKWLLLAGVAFSMVIETVLDQKVISGSMALAAVAVVWVLLSYRSMKSTRMAAQSSSLIAAGDYEQAEEHIDQALRGFSLFRAVKLRSLHHLAVLRHAQRRWGEAVMLCRELLGQRLGMLAGLIRSAQLILADSLLELGDVRGAYTAISGLYQQRLSLAEALELIAVQVDYLWRVDAWQEMMAGASHKVQMAELMPPPKAARTEALLALAARKTGHADWERWLMRRVELLADGKDLVRIRPVLAELWPG